MADNSDTVTKMGGSGNPAPAPRFHRPVGDALMRASEALAVIGGGVLLLIIMLTVVSVVGRAAFNRPLLGDSEIVEVGVAFSIFSYLAYCQMRGANVIVDFFTRPLPVRVRDLIDSAADLVFAAVVLLLTWRLALGGIDTYARGDVSMFLLIPNWWGYVGAFVSCLVWAAACLYTAFSPLIGIPRKREPEKL